MTKSQLSISKLIPLKSPRHRKGDQSPSLSFLRSLSLWARCIKRRGMLIPRHAEDKTGTMLGEIRLGLVNLGFHGDGAFPPVQAALDRVGDADLQSAFLTAKAKGKRRVRQEGWDVVTVAQTLVQGRERWFWIRQQAEPTALSHAAALNPAFGLG